MLTQVEFGWIELTASERGLRRIELFRRKPKRCISRKSDKFLQGVSSDILSYLRRENVPFDYPLDLDGHSPFSRKVYDIIRTVPFGEARTYGWVAKLLGNKNLSRAVGGALRANPLPIIIPCHRITGSDGNLGGYSGGVYWKKKLLEIENE